MCFYSLSPSAQKGRYYANTDHAQVPSHPMA